MFEKIITVVLLLGILGILILINTVLGSIIANKNNKFEFEKFRSGIIKALTIGVCVALFCLCLELVPLVLSRVGIEIPSDLITVLQVVMLCLSAYKKYAFDCFEKMKVILKITEESENEK